MDICLLTVGELSKLTGVSKQAIRYYDSIGLLKPGRVDDNGYRYYEPMHVLYLNSIMRLKQLGCSLEEAQRYIAGRDIGDVRNMLVVRRDLAEKKIQELQHALEALNMQISQVDEGLSARELEGVHIRTQPERYFVYLESSEKPGLKQAVMQVGTLVKELDAKGLLYVGSPVFEIIKGRLKTGFFMRTEPKGFNVDTVPAGAYACMTHRGAYSQVNHTLDQLKSYLSVKGWPSLSNCYQLFLIDYALVHSDKELVTELQIRIEKKP